MPDIIKKFRKRHLRNLDRNKSGRKRTVVMGYYTGGKNDEKNYAAPTITFKGNEKERPQTFREALEVGEVYEFKRREKAERFAAGSWKKGKDKREAMKAYRQSKKVKRKL